MNTVPRFTLKHTPHIYLIKSQPLKSDNGTKAYHSGFISINRTALLKTQWDTGIFTCSLTFFRTEMNQFALYVDWRGLEVAFSWRSPPK